MLRNIIIIIALVGGLIACQSSPRKNYFVLSAISPPSDLYSGRAQSVPADSKAVYSIGIGPIEVADYLDRSYIGYAENDNTLTIIDNNYWAEPLEKGIARVMALNLSQLSPHNSFINFPWRSDNKPHYSFRIQLHSLTRNNHQASISATWELLDHSNKSIIQRKNFTQSVSIESNTKTLVQGYSKLLGKLAEEMNQSLNAIH